MSEHKNEAGRATVTSLKRQMDGLQEAIKSLQVAQNGFEAVLSDLKSRFGKIEVAAPPQLRALEFDSVAKILAAEPYAEFEVLKEWKHVGSHLPPGRVIRADHYPQLLDYVRAGLLLGVPQDQNAQIEAYKEQAKARLEASRAEAVLRAQQIEKEAAEQVAALRGHE